MTLRDAEDRRAVLVRQLRRSLRAASIATALLAASAVPASAGGASSGGGGPAAAVALGTTAVTPGAPSPSGSRLVGPYEIADRSPGDFASAPAIHLAPTLGRGRLAWARATCPPAATAGCAGELTLGWLGRNHSARSLRRIELSMRAGETVASPVGLPRRAVRLLRRGRRVRLTATLVARDPLGATHALTQRVLLQLAARR